MTSAATKHTQTKATNIESSGVDVEAEKQADVSNSEADFDRPQCTVVARDFKQVLRDHLATDLCHVNRVLKSNLRSNSPLVAEMVNHVSRYQGKQLRPILLLLAHRMASLQKDRESDTEMKKSSERLTEQTGDLDSACVLAASVEMIHLATLVHDDVIDEADTRRHVATVHRRWDTEASVLLGDFLFSRAFHLSAQTGDAMSCALIGKATDRTCEGELNQMAARLDQSESEFDYFRIIRGKTGQLFSLSCRLGVRSASASIIQQNAAARFGHRLGLAFQIADDILDLTESSDDTGKDAANDLQNGRRTLPILRALQFANASEAETLNRLLTDSSGSSHQHLQAMPCVVKGIKSAVHTGRQLIERAIRDLGVFPDNEERQLLQTIAEFAVERRS